MELRDVIPAVYDEEDVGSYASAEDGDVLVHLGRRMMTWAYRLTGLCKCGFTDLHKVGVNGSRACVLHICVIVYIHNYVIAGLRVCGYAHVRSVKARRTV